MTFDGRAGGPAYVYLDQAKWIDLARAANGDPAAARFEPALAAARTAVTTGRAAFPLSSGHYIETWRQTDDGRRKRLAHTMSELSRHVTMASPPVLCNVEIDAYLHNRFGRPPVPRTCPVFGRGGGHTTEFAPLPDQPYDAAREESLLAHRPPGFLPHGRGHLDYAEAYADAERLLSDSAPSLGKHARYTLFATAVAEIGENIAEALARASLPADLFMQFLVEEPEDFIMALPTRAAAARLREVRHRNPQKRWEPNDMNDVAYNACAVVHCDVVITERFWADMLRRSGLDAEHHALVLTDVAELPHVLADACHDLQNGSIESAQF
jgi:hypothetical protein